VAVLCKKIFVLNTTGVEGESLPMAKKQMKSQPLKANVSLSAREYVKFLDVLKEKIRASQLKAALSANQELIKLYWEIGKDIAGRQKSGGWGSKIIERIGKDLQEEFPGVEGFSKRNIFRMRSFYLAYQVVPQAVAQLEALPVFRIPWGHNAVLLERVKDTGIRLWYAQQAIENGWSRSVLEMWIDSNLHRRQGKAITNFKISLPEARSDIAEQAIKDPYVFDFLSLGKKYREKELEQGLMDHLQNFLVELGEGFAFMGRQFSIEVEGEDYLIDLLFYHVKLRCYFVVELKATEFDPRDAGQMNFYLSAVDDHLRHPGDQPSIGILLCKTKSKVKVEYALRNCKSPISVTSYETRILKGLPRNLKSSLPTVEEIEAELSTVKGNGKSALTKLKKYAKNKVRAD
jgi:predicted nuclease of restriction endonuclease-like (RecB) superfamily